MLWKLTREGDVGMDMAWVILARMECCSCHRWNRFLTADRTCQTRTAVYRSVRWLFMCLLIYHPCMQISRTRVFSERQIIVFWKHTLKESKNYYLSVQKHPTRVVLDRQIIVFCSLSLSEMISVHATHLKTHISRPSKHTGQPHAAVNRKQFVYSGRLRSYIKIRQSRQRDVSALRRIFLDDMSTNHCQQPPVASSPGFYYQCLFVSF